VAFGTTSIRLPFLFLQALDSGNQGFDQRHQIGVGNLIELVTGWQYHFRLENTRFHVTRVITSRQ
jgi:hypothetical protein